VDSHVRQSVQRHRCYLIELGREDDAIPWLKRAIDSPRYEARQFPHVNLARIYEKKGQVLDAVAEYGRAVDKLPGYAPAVAGCDACREG